MPDTEQTGDTELVEAAKKEIDAALDTVEALVETKIKPFIEAKIKFAPARILADGAVGVLVGAFKTLREIIGVPDNYAGDAD